MGTVHAESRALALGDALFGRVRQGVLGLLFGHPQRSFYASEIIRHLGAGSGAVQRELARLEAAGLLIASRIGRQKHYQANRAAPVYAELRGIVLKTSGLADVLRSALSGLEAHVRAAFVFGSMAKGLDAAASDIDLMVISDDLAYPELFARLETASAQLARTIHPTIYTSEDFERRVREDNPFLTKVLAQARIWILGSDDDLGAR